MIQLNQTVYDIFYRTIDVCGIFLDAVLIIFLADHYFPIRNPNLKKHPWIFYICSFLSLCTFIYIVGFSSFFGLFSVSLPGSSVISFFFIGEVLS